ncbi:hypothetical protein [Enterobacter cloacae]|uniref:hypothetical protein n=1 Tax=Enterobacter cloacae TaxID=550 RepID=UPI0032AF9131
MAIELSGAYKMIRSHYDGISLSPSKKWKSRTFVTDASAKKKTFKNHKQRDFPSATKKKNFCSGALPRVSALRITFPYS